MPNLEAASPNEEPQNESKPTVALVVDDGSNDVPPERVGNLLVVGRVVNWNQTPSFSDISALLEPYAEVKPGQFLGVLHDRRSPQAITVVQVGNAFEVNPNEAPELAAARTALGLGRSYGPEGVSTRIFRLAECATVEEFDVTDVGGTLRAIGDGRAPQLLARAGYLVVLLPPELVMASIGGLPDDSMGVHLGTTTDAAPVQVTLKPDMMQFHAGIFGNPGRGKSYLTGVLLEEAAAWGVPSLVLDINGEFGAAVRQLGGLVLTLPDPENFGLSLNLITPQELVAVTPNVQAGTQYAELIELAHDQLRNESRGARITFEMLRDRITRIGESTKTAPASVNAAKARISTLERDPLVGGEFDFVKTLEEHRLVVLDCRFLSLRQTQLIAAMGARELQRIGRERARAAEGGDATAVDWFALYFVDEAHAVIPNDDKVVSTQVFFELARMGRHVRTGLVLSSQSPSDLNSSVLKRLQMRFVFALERDQLRSIHGVLADLDEKIVAQLPKLQRGVCAVSGSSDLVRHGFLLRVRPRETKAGGSTPPVFARRVKGGGGQESDDA